MATMVIHISHTFPVALSKHFSINNAPNFNITLVIEKFHFKTLRMRWKQFVPGQTPSGNR